MSLGGSGGGTSNYRISTTRFAFNEPHSNVVREIIELQDGSLISCSDDKHVKRWSTNGQPLNSFGGHTNAVHCVLELDETTLVSGGGDQTIRLWNRGSNGGSRTIPTTSVCHSLLKLDKTRLSASSTSSTHDGESSSSSSSLSSSSSRTSMFVSGMGDGAIRIWKSGGSSGEVECVSTLKHHMGGVYGLCELSTSTHDYTVDSTNTNNTLVSASFDNSLKLWDIEKSACFKTLTGHTNGIYRVIPLRNSTGTGNGRIVATASWDKLIKIWDLSIGTQACVATFKGHIAGISGLAELSDGSLVSGAGDKMLMVWNPRGTRVLPLSSCELDFGIMCVEELQDGSIAVGGGKIKEFGKIEIRRTWNSIGSMQAAATSMLPSVHGLSGSNSPVRRSSVGCSTDHGAGAVIASVIAAGGRRGSVGSSIEARSSPTIPGSPLSREGSSGSVDTSKSLDKRERSLKQEKKKLKKEKKQFKGTYI